MAQLTVVERLDKLLVSSESSIQLSPVYNLYLMQYNHIVIKWYNNIIQTHVSKAATHSPAPVSRAVEVHTNSGPTWYCGTLWTLGREYEVRIYFNFSLQTCHNDETNSSQLDFFFSLNYCRGRHVWVLFFLHWTSGVLSWYNDQSTFISVNFLYVKTLNKTKEMYGRNPANITDNHF